MNGAGKIKIAVSSCLAGYNVRYDGKNKKLDVINQLCDLFDCIAICPESEIGLGIPRPPLNIVKINNSFRVRGRTNPAFDVTDALQKHAQHIVCCHRDICGYVFKSRSPSCGVYSTPWRRISKEETGLTSGIFSAQIRELLPSLPVIEETQLENSEHLNEFVNAVRRYAEELTNL